ncbi:MAG TPA: helicase C-terminal domain-containing protein [Kiritimatiellia bacterium]|nr:helicase C-terminal domain-containing protein [Kiritimatiellia bacterium]HMO98793.1 helicase C-terminal domain-containing protein [Kiritimatiellia bacterium]HMP96874.1 helicase C-terminal domain-containing protein [Kiritimatiellia bacterium]
MIAPYQENETPPPERPVLRPAVQRFFAPGGPLARDAAFGFEARPQQTEMADLVSRAIEEGHHLAVEAGTGVGKSLAYLVPAIQAALDQNIQVVVSTYTISLQEQLMNKDLPLIQRLLGRPFKAVLAKGRSNYLCLRRLARARRMERDLFRPEDVPEIERIQIWADQPGDGSLQSMDFQPSPEVWSAVQVEAGNCMWQRCPEYAPCHFMRARRDIRNAHVVVVNHSLFFADLALKGQGASLLPDYRIAILDEAHQLENVASQHLGIRLSQASVEYWLRRLYSADGARGLLVALRKGRAAQQVTDLRAELAVLVGELEQWAAFDTKGYARVVPEPLGIATALPHKIDALLAELRAIHDEVDNMDVRAELSASRRRGAEIRMMVDTFLNQSLDDQVYWLEREGSRRRQTVMYSAPIEVGPHLKDQLFGDDRTIIMTSATLAVNDSLDYFCRRIGAEAAQTASVGSPYDYARQMTIHIPKGMPDPASGEAYLAACERALHRYIDHSRARAFVLCTNAKFMRDLHARTVGRLADSGYAVFSQHEGLPRHTMIERFKNEPAGVLFGLDSFWMGVDVRGEALSNVIITRLPFAVPDEPVVKARMDRIAEQGGDPFKQYSLPEAILKFRQGVGRLIRSATDTGIVVILDPRIHAKWYGRYFLKALPDAPVQWDELDTAT